KHSEKKHDETIYNAKSNDGKTHDIYINELKNIFGFIKAIKAKVKGGGGGAGFTVIHNKEVLKFPIEYEGSGAIFD
ncbi:hypothetical protein ACJX0J_009654, partial [Zea mays]